MIQLIRPCQTPASSGEACAYAVSSSELFPDFLSEDKNTNRRRVLYVIKKIQNDWLISAEFEFKASGSANYKLDYYVFDIYHQLNKKLVLFSMANSDTVKTENRFIKGSRNAI